MKQGAVFVMPRRSTEWADAPGIWITAAGWADAAQRRLGHAWVVTRDRVATPHETVAFTEPLPPMRSTLRDIPAPLVVRTAAKDALRGWEAYKARDVGERVQWRDIELAFVWQHHDLFHFAGEPLARRHHVPLVSYVHAPQVWEAARWGVRRPGWAGSLERLGDRPPLMHSDVVACVSEEVADEVVRLGVERDHVIVSPMAVDARRFSPSVSGRAARERLGLGDAFVVGWTGSFRKFHGLDTALEAFAMFARCAPESRLLLVGDGPERDAVEDVARRLGIIESVTFAGATAHEDLPELVAAMDVTVVTVLDAEAFHYSPQKMREYLSCGRAVVAPRVGDVARTVTDHVDALLYDAGDAQAFADRLLELRDDADLREQLGQAGRSLIERTGTWDARLDQLLSSEAFRRAPGGRRVVNRAEGGFGGDDL
ncbi:MAG: glycosyltransferase family 4 protein [Acidimicrobiia bacterium]